MFNSETETVVIDPQFQRRMYGVLLNIYAKDRRCPNCEQKFYLCPCVRYEDGENGIPEGVRV